jgi:hypothetical protein
VTSGSKTARQPRRGEILPSTHRRVCAINDWFAFFDLRSQQKKQIDGAECSPKEQTSLWISRYAGISRGASRYVGSDQQQCVTTIAEQKPVAPTAALSFFDRPETRKSSNGEMELITKHWRQNTGFPMVRHGAPWSGNGF